MSDGTGDAAASPLRPRQRNRLRSRVDRFARLVEETGSGRHHHRPTAEDSDLLALVKLAHLLGRVQPPTVREQFRQELHDRLQAEFARQQRAARSDHATAQSPAAQSPAARSLADEPGLGPEPNHKPTDVGTLADVKTQVIRQFRPRRGHGRLAVAIGLATGALALSGVSAASGGALPGDPLYSVKRSGEQAQLMLAGSDTSRGRLHLDFARNRLVEAHRMTPDNVGAVLAEMDQEIAEAARLLFTAAVQTGDVSLIDTVAAFAVQHRADLLELRASVRLPDDRISASLSLLDAVQVRADELRAAIADGCPTVGADRLGPTPAC